MRQTLSHRFNVRLERFFPEQRLFLRSDTETRFIRLSPLTQFTAIAGSALVIGWTIIASAILLMDSITAGNARDQASRDLAMYEDRLNAIAQQRDDAAEEARQAQARFAAALSSVSDMQARLLENEERRRELDKGIEVIQATLRRTLKERDAAREERATLVARLEGGAAPGAALAGTSAATGAMDLVAEALAETAAERDAMEQFVAEAETQLSEMEFERQLVEERNERIFSQIEDAVTLSMEPLAEMFSEAGLPTDSILGQVRATYSGQGGPLTPITLSTKGQAPDATSLRASALLKQLDELNLYRIAVEQTPFAMPVFGSYRQTSGFGPRWGRMHNGTDFAGRHGLPIHTTADGVVKTAARQSGYGNIVVVTHPNGLETRYAHLSKIHVKVGERVSRGDHIGDMGNTGRSTGTHLHYEIRVNGKPVNPMNFIKAARDVF
ncbi:MAG: M23 family metallopeptidase [Pseudomonadota bacterium]